MEKDMILLLNGSLRKSKSNSNHFLNLLKTQLKDSYESVQLYQRKDLNVMKDLLQKADACVIGMPVYVCLLYTSPCKKASSYYVRIIR